MMDGTFYEEVVECPQEDVPLYLNDENEYIVEIAKLRMENPGTDFKDLLDTKEAWDPFKDLLKEALGNDEYSTDTEYEETKSEIETLIGVALCIDEEEWADTFRNPVP